LCLVKLQVDKTTCSSLAAVLRSRDRENLPVFLSVQDFFTPQFKAYSRAPEYNLWTDQRNCKTSI